MLTLDQIRNAVVAGKKSACLDGRDFGRLADFFPPKDLGLFGFELKDGVDPSEFKVAQFDEATIKNKLEGDLCFAFEKALNKRGISASLMFEVVRMWLWVLEDELQTWPENEYAHYGLPFLKAVALKYGFENPIGEDRGDEDKYAG